MTRVQNITGMPVMKAKCKSCPFGDNGDLGLRVKIELRLLQVSQTCHSTGVAVGKKDTHICRGARDWQLMILYRMRILKAPTDEAWQLRAQELKNHEQKH